LICSSVVIFFVYVSEKLEVRFSQLKLDLMNPHNTLEDVFSYLQELRDGTERNFVLKRFFWKVTASRFHSSR
jgi:hypothetical protein